MNKTILTLVTISILLFFVYLIANYYTEYKRSAYKPAFVSLKFKLNADNMDKILLEKDVEKIELVKVKKQWKIKDIRYPADASKIFGLISRLNEIKQGKIVSIDPAQFDVYSVGTKTGIKTTFYNNDKEVVSVVIGKNNENSTGAFFRFPNENKVYLVDPLLENDISIEKQFWVKKELKTVEKDSIYKIIIRGDSKYNFIKSGKKWWIKKPRIAPASESKIKEILDKYGYLTVTDIDRTKNVSECIKDKPKYKITIKYMTKKDNKDVKKSYTILIGSQLGQDKEIYYAIAPPQKVCFLLSSAYVEPLRLAWFEAIERELIPSNLFAHEVASLEFDNFIRGKATFKKKKVGKNDYRWLVGYKGRFKLKKYDKGRNLVELLKGIKVEDYQQYDQHVKFNRLFILKTETKDIYASSIFYDKDSKECTVHTNRFPKLLLKVLCSDLTQIEDNIKKLSKAK